MSLIKTAGASAAFFYPSYINGDTYTAGGIVASTMQALAHRLYQMDPTAPWQGSAGVDDSQVETITATLYSGVAQVQRVIDSIFILGNNLNNFVLQYSVDEGSTWTNIATVTGNAGADYVHGFFAVLGLGALILALRRNTGGDMKYADSAICSVYTLAAVA